MTCPDCNHREHIAAGGGLVPIFTTRRRGRTTVTAMLPDGRQVARYSDDRYLGRANAIHGVKVAVREALA